MSATSTEQGSEPEQSHLIAALTPSAETKAAYIGEFSFKIDTVDVDEDGEAFECDLEVTVPWTTVKEIMAAIRGFAISRTQHSGEK